MYNYLEVVKSDVMDYIKESIDTKDYLDRDDLEQSLNDCLWTVDIVTGNASGSYTFSSWKAKEYVTENMDLLREMCMEFGVEIQEIGEKLLDEEWEWMDVSIRCYLLAQGVAAALDEMEEEGKLTFGDDEEDEEE